MIDTQTGPHQDPRKALTGNQEPASVQPAQRRLIRSPREQFADISCQVDAASIRAQGGQGGGRRVGMLLEELGALGGGSGGCSWYQSQREPEAGTWMNPPAAAPLILPAKPPRPSSPARPTPLQESGTRPEFIQLFLNSSLIFPG